MKLLYLLTLILLSCNGQEENTNDYGDIIGGGTGGVWTIDANDPVIICDDLTGNEYEYIGSEWQTVDSISAEQTNKMDLKNSIIAGTFKVKATGTGKSKVTVIFPIKKDTIPTDTIPKLSKKDSALIFILVILETRLFHLEEALKLHLESCTGSPEAITTPGTPYKDQEKKKLRIED